MFEESRDADRRAIHVQVLRARSRAALAAVAARSALSVQLPALDQRADDRRSARGAPDVSAPRRVPARDARARRREPHHGRARAEARRPLSRGRADPVRRPARRRSVGTTPTPSRAWFRRCCCSRSSRTPSRTASRICSERGTIRIAASRTPARLSIVVENPCDPDRPRGTGTGVGVSNVRARLRALYGAEAVMNSSEQGGVWRMELSFPATTEPA